MIDISNILEVRQFLKEYLLENRQKVRYILERYPYKRSVTCAEVNGRCYADEALCGSNLTETDLMNIVEVIPRLINDLESVKKINLRDKLREDVFELRMNVSSGRIFRLLFVQKRRICFLNGFIKKTQKTLEKEIRKAIEIKNRLYDIVVITEF